MHEAFVNNIFATSYYAILSLGLIGVLFLTLGLWSLGLNFVYKRIKAAHHFFEYFRYRKEFLKWLKGKKA